jgi:SARP family transcriptional regulator, regulator of embCAB operon
MRYEMLGNFRVIDAAGPRSISAQKVETLLGALLVRADQLVLTEQLITEIWGQYPPVRATAGIHVYVSQLRKYLSGIDPEHRPIVTRPSGYLLRLGSDELDVRIFLDLVASGRAYYKEGDFYEARAVLSDALALWRGPVHGEGRDGPILGGFTIWLNETHAECTELLVDAQLKLGRHRELIGWLYSLIAEHPLREAFSRQLMLALYRCGRRADALKVYQSVRSTLNEELGIDPGRELRDMRQAIITSDARLDLGVDAGLVLAGA